MSTADPPMPSYTKTWHTTSYPAINPKRPELSAKGKNVIITGGGSGIGARTALSFAEAGASNIALVGRTESKLESTKQGLLTKFPNVNFHNIVADIMDRHAIKEGFLAFSQAVGKVDVLVSNAGYGAEASPIDSIDFDEYFLCLDVNLKGSVIVGYSFAQVAASDAVIVNLASIISFLPFAPNFSAYAVSKAAGVRFFDAVQYEHPDWRVYNIQPGTVDTSMSRKAGVPASDDVSLPADFIQWLSTPEAAFAKGKYLCANWDVDEMKEKADLIANSNVLTITLEGWPFGAPVS